MDQHPAHVQGIGDKTGMLGSGAAECHQRVFRHIISTLDRDFLDCLGHIFNGDFQEAIGYLFGRLAGFIGQFGKLRGDGRRVQRFIRAGTEDMGEEAGIDLASHQIGIGDGQRAAAPIARRSRIGPGAVRSDPHPRAIKRQDRPPPAATVWMAIIGARMRTPATSVSKARSYSPS